MPLDDVFEPSMRKVWKDGIVDVNVVFAARVLLGAIDILGKGFEGGTSILKEAAHAEESGNNVEGYGHVEYRSWELELIKHINDRISKPMQNPLFPIIRKNRLANVDFRAESDPKLINPPIEVRPSTMFF